MRDRTATEAYIQGRFDLTIGKWVGDHFWRAAHSQFNPEMKPKVQFPNHMDMTHVSAELVNGSAAGMQSIVI